MPSDSPLLTIAIPTYNRAPFLDELLSGLAGSSDLPEARAGEFEILVVDNASTDDTPAVCARHLPGLAHGRVIRQPENVGFPRNVRTAFDAARGRYVWTLCDDDLADLALIPRLLAALRTHPEAAAFLLNRDIYDVTMTRLLRGNCLGSRATVVHPSWTGKLGHAGDLLTASCTVLRRDATRPGFDHPSFTGTYCETMVLALHAMQVGDLVVLGDLVIRYREGNNGSWNALWPWIYFYNMPMVVHHVLDSPGDWSMAKLYVGGRKNSLLYNCSYLASSPIPKIRTGVDWGAIKEVYSSCRGASVICKLIIAVPRVVSRIYVISIMGFGAFRRRLGGAKSIGDLLAIPLFLVDRYKQHKNKELN